MAWVEVLHDDDRSAEVPRQAFEDPDQRVQPACRGSESYHVERGARRLRKAGSFGVRHFLSHVPCRQHSPRRLAAATKQRPWTLAEPVTVATAVTFYTHRPGLLLRSRPKHS